MPKIMHYMSEDEMNVPVGQPTEYIVITDDDDADPEEMCRSGFRFNESYELDDTGSLPTERVLLPD